MNIGKRARAMQLEKLAQAKYEALLKEAVNTDVDMTNLNDLTQSQNVEVAQTLPITWRNATEETGKQKYIRTLNYSRETISRKKSMLAKAAIGSRSIHDFFNTKPKEVPPPEAVKVVYRPRRPDEATLEKIRNTLPLMDPKVRISNKNVRQCEEGIPQYLKYLVVYKMMLFLLEGKSFVEASTIAVTNNWPGASKYYRRRVARGWLNAMLETGEIPLHQQGKHIKRRSILCDPEVEEKCVQWLHSQQPTDISLSFLRQYIQDHVLPEVLDRTAATEDAEDETGLQTIVPLPNSTLATYKKSWGF